MCLSITYFKFSFPLQPSSDLYELIQILCLTFGDDPPVYSKVNQPPSRPPPPSFGGQQQYYQGMPNQTPYPTPQTGGMPMPNSQSGGYYPPTSMPYPNANTRTPYPTSQSGMPPYQSHTSPPTSSYPPPSSQPQPQPQPPYQRSTPGYPPYSTSSVKRDGDTQTFQTRNAPTRQGSVVDPNVLKASILSSVEDKLKKRVNEVFEQAKVGSFLVYFLLIKIFSTPFQFLSFGGHCYFLIQRIIDFNDGGL